MPADKKSRSRLTRLTRNKIFELIGDTCALAEEDGEHCDGPLEVDHFAGRDWVPKKVSSYQRNRRYLKEALEGKVRALCKWHNKRVRPKRNTTAEDQPVTTMQPF